MSQMTDPAAALEAAAKSPRIDPCEEALYQLRDEHGTVVAHQYVAAILEGRAAQAEIARLLTACTNWDVTAKSVSGCKAKIKEGKVTI